MEREDWENIGSQAYLVLSVMGGLVILLGRAKGWNERCYGIWRDGDTGRI